MRLLVYNAGADDSATAVDAAAATAAALGDDANPDTDESAVSSSWTDVDSTSAMSPTLTAAAASVAGTLLPLAGTVVPALAESAELVVVPAAAAATTASESAAGAS